jgi:hypothetical protein
MIHLSLLAARLIYAIIGQLAQPYHFSSLLHALPSCQNTCSSFMICLCPTALLSNAFILTLSSSLFFCSLHTSSANYVQIYNTSAELGTFSSHLCQEKSISPSPMNLHKAKSTPKIFKKPEKTGKNRQFTAGRFNYHWLTHPAPVQLTTE